VEDANGEDYQKTIAALNRPSMVGIANTLFAPLGPCIAAVEDLYAAER
jgi:hypothetical protein